MPDPEPQPSSKIHEEHLELRKTLERLRAAEEPEQLITMLADLNTQLEHHFEEEEGEEGLAQIIESTLPQNMRHLDKIFDEHKEFLSRVASLMHRARDLQGEQIKLHADVNALCHDLHVHEQNETKLITDAVYTDIGSGD